MPATRDLTMYQGDTYEHELTVTDDADPPVALDLSTGTWRAQVRKHAQATSVLASFAVDDTDAANGVLFLTLTPEQTAALPSNCTWDLEDTVAGVTYLRGAVTVEREVTRT